MGAPHPAEDGYQVVLTHGEHVDVFDDHHLVMVLVEDGVVHHVCQNRSIKKVTLKKELLVRASGNTFFFFFLNDSTFFWEQYFVLIHAYLYSIILFILQLESTQVIL